MNVLVVVVDNNIGGIQNRILCLSDQLKINGINLIILTPNTPGTFSEKAKNKKLIVYQKLIQSPKLNNSFLNSLNNLIWILQFPMGVIQTISVIKKEKIEIIHVNGLLALHAVFAGYLLRKKIIWHLISTIYPQYLVKILRPLILRIPERIILVTNNTRNYYFGQNRYYSNISIIYEPVDLQYFDNKTEFKKIGNTLLLEKYKIPAESNLIGFIGNINPQKDLENFIKTANEVKKRVHRNIKFFIIGESTRGHETYYNSLKSLIYRLNLNDDIIFTGRLNDLRPILSKLDIFLLTSIAEGTPIVILEAMAMEVPVVSTNVGGISEQIIDGTTGLLVPPKNLNSLVESILFLLKNDELRKKMGVMGRERVEELFSIEICVKKHLEIYREVLNVE